jgi:hypothetical protein
VLADGDGFPVGDDRWQYPPAAAVVLVMPAAIETLTHLPYLAGFLVMVLATDAATTAALLRFSAPRSSTPRSSMLGSSAPGRTVPGVGRSAELSISTRDALPGHAAPGSSVDGARIWVVGLFALGPVALARFDVVPAACVVVALLALGRSWSGRAGFALGMGALVKVWPALLLPTMRVARDRATAALAGGLVAAVATLAAVLAGSGTWHDATGFLGAQKARGLQLEAVPATVLVFARMVGVGEAPTYSYGSLQFSSELARAVATACSLVEVAVVVAAALWWWTRPADDPVPVAHRALALLLLVVVTSRVLSPQYLVWLLALAACRPDPGGAAGSRVGLADRRVTCLLLVAALLSQVIYPFRYNDVIEGRIVASTLLIVRNLLLVAVTVQLSLKVVAASRRRRTRQLRLSPPQQRPPT